MTRRINAEGLWLVKQYDFCLGPLIMANVSARH